MSFEESQRTQNQQVQPPLKDTMQNIIAFVIAFLLSFFCSPFICTVTSNPAASFAANVTDGFLDVEFARILWGICVFVGIFSGAFYFIHIKLTVKGARMITKAFEPEMRELNKQKDSKVGDFIKGAFFMFLLLLVLGSLTACDGKEQQVHERQMQQDVLDHERALKRDEQNHEQIMAKGRGRHAEAMLDKEHAEAEKKRLHEMSLKELAIAAEKTAHQMAIDAERVAQQAFHDLMKGTISPLIIWITGLTAFSGLAGFGFFRFCSMRERVAEMNAKAAIAKAFAESMNEQARERAFNALMGNSDVIDVKAIEGA